MAHTAGVRRSCSYWKNQILEKLPAFQESGVGFTRGKCWKRDSCWRSITDFKSLLINIFDPQGLLPEMSLQCPLLMKFIILPSDMGNVYKTQICFHRLGIKGELEWRGNELICKNIQ